MLFVLGYNVEWSFFIVNRALGKVWLQYASHLISLFSFSWKVLRAQAKDSNFVGKETAENQVQSQYVSARKKSCVQYPRASGFCSRMSGFCPSCARHSKWSTVRDEILGGQWEWLLGYYIKFTACPKSKPETCVTLHPDVCSAHCTVLFLEMIVKKKNNKSG